ncbi:MAG TPA: CHAD domain-containing protein [Acidimicrobiia bacterium]|nr:CHAD domain-containing protein [Acidimicrobiia bacterium]
MTPLPPKPTSSDVVANAIRRSVAGHLRDAPGIVLGEDPECLHRARVAIRRLRSDLRTFKPLLESSWSRSLRSDLRQLGAVLGAVRDSDVLILRFEDSARRLPSVEGIEPLVATLVASRTARREELLAFMEGNLYAELLDRLVEAAVNPAIDPQCPTSVTRLNRLMRRPWRRLARAVKRLPDDPPDEMLHAVRIDTKRARYASEALAPALGKPARRFAKHAANLQKVLGNLQDAALAYEWLSCWSATRNEPRSTFVAGQLAGLEIARGSTARATWRDAWDDLSRAKNTSWIA